MLLRSGRELRRAPSASSRCCAAHRAPRSRVTDPLAATGPACDVQAPDLIEPVVGFRNWRLIDGVLVSPHSGVEWQEPLLCARCLLDPEVHVAPDPDCDCGVSAYHEPQLRFSTVDFRGVSGIVTLWGRVEVHPDRVRGEFARIEALAVYSRWSRRQRTAVEAVAGKLGVDVVDLHGQAEAAIAYGAALPPELAPAS